MNRAGNTRSSTEKAVPLGQAFRISRTCAAIAVLAEAAGALSFPAPRELAVAPVVAAAAEVVTGAAASPAAFAAEFSPRADPSARRRVVPLRLPGPRYPPRYRRARPRPPYRWPPEDSHSLPGSSPAVFLLAG